MSIITTSISINEEAETIFVETTVWNSNQFRISISQIVFRILNFDSIKEELMKANKRFNCDEFDNLSKDCSKFKKFKVVEMNVRNDTKNWKKE
jgi:hypothetical protein